MRLLSAVGVLVACASCGAASRDARSESARDAGSAAAGLSSGPADAGSEAPAKLALRGCFDAHADPSFTWIAHLSDDGRLALGFEGTDHAGPGSLQLFDLGRPSPLDAPEVVSIGGLMGIESALMLGSRTAGWVGASQPFASRDGLIEIVRPSQPPVIARLDARAYHNRGAFSLAATSDLETIAVGMTFAIAAGCDDRRDFCIHPGAVEIYRRSGSVLALVETVQPETVRHDHAFFGSSVSMSADGSVLAAGSEERALVFVKRGVAYALADEIVPPDDAGLSFVVQHFGDEVSMSSDGRMVVIGNPTFGSDRGRVLVFTRRGDAWTRAADLLGPARNLRLGDVASISPDGKVVAAAAAEGDERHLFVFRATTAGTFVAPHAVDLPKARPGSGSYLRWIGLDRTGGHVATLDSDGTVCVLQ